MTTTIAASTIADPFDIQVTMQALGSSQRSVNGTVMLDYFSNVPKYNIAMQWRVLTLAERDAVIAACCGCITASRVLVLPDTRSFTVYLDMEKDMTETMIRTASGHKYNLSAAFLEV
jgi:hypothetical protein